ncbi:MAG TPA: protein kinase [Solirubrobacterales bacterium]|nr:protein kinase [Solirubrobacterales bacterium]
MRCPACGNENREGARFCDSCGTELTVSAPRLSPVPDRPLPESVPAEIAGGRYRVRRFLGEGGRKQVYLADDTAAGREVAVALFDTEHVAAAVQARTKREAQAMSKLGDHPHVVSVLDTGEQDGNPFIVSEYMPGGDVEALLAAEGGRLEVERAVAVAADVTRALEHAHARGIVHRDLKPANVWLDDDGSARLGDFGLATTEARARVSMGNLVGTVAYLPPEQAVGEPAGPESDLYSLGALLYEMLTGRPPFPGEDAVSIISRHLHAEPVPPSRHNPDVPEALDGVVLALLAKRREDRPADAAEVRRRLTAALSEEPADGGGERGRNPLESLARGVFVGRDAEVEQMRAAVDGTLAGAGRLQLLVGEPGIGKTRAAEELATYGRVRGARVYWGRCREDDGAPAYWPWVQAIRGLVRDADPVAMAWQMGAGAADVAHLVPEIAERLDIEPVEALESEEARFRLFDSVTSFLVAAARDRPMVLVLDDLHWADEPSLLLLKYAAAEVASSGLLIVGTYRDVELGRHHPLARVLGELRSDRGDRIALRGLSTADVASYIEMTSGSPPAPGLADAVHRQTDGNPFFVGEVVRLLASEGRLGDGPESWEPVIPQGVREVVGRRLDRLSAETNQALRVAAAIGREFDGELLIRVAGLSPAQLLAAANEAVAERLVTDQGGGRYSFAHALVRDTVYEEISPVQRSQLHERIGLALEELCDDDPSERLGELAHHFLAAAPRGDLAKTIEYAERAGEQDMEQLAYEEAVDVYSRALEVLELSDEPDEAHRCRVLLALGGAEAKAARVADAREAFERAAVSARALGDHDSLVGAAIGIAMMSAAGTVDEELLALIDEALDAIGPERTARRAALLSAKSAELYWVDNDLTASAALVDEAIEIAREIGAPRTLAAALHRKIFIPFGPDATEERLRIADEMLALGEATGDRESTLRGHAYRLWQLLELGDLEGVDAELAMYERLADELRMPEHGWHTFALRGMRVLMDGDIAEAERLAEEARRAGERAEQSLASQYYGVQLTQIRSLQGRAEELLPAVRDLAGRFPGIPAWRTGLISLAARSGDVEEGRLQLERFAGRDLSALRRDANWFTAASLLGEAVALLGDSDRAGPIYDELLPYAGRLIVVGRAAGCNGPVDRVLGLLAAACGRTEDAIGHLEDSIEISRRSGDKPGLAVARVDLAEQLLGRGRRADSERALSLLSEGLFAAREMGARGIADRALRLRLEAQGLSGVDVTTSIDEVVSALEHERPDLRAHAAPDGTVAILFSDIEDSTLITERLGDERWLEVLREHNAIFRRELARYDGYEVKSQGDGFMLAFPDPARAMECAVAVQRAFAERERGGLGEALRVRIGLHTGEVIAEEGDFFGKNVVLAARIAAEACGGEILASEEMRAAARGVDGLAFDDGRELELKGLAGRHRVYSADWTGDGAPVSAPLADTA